MNGVTIEEVRTPRGKPGLRDVRLVDGRSLRVPADLVRDQNLAAGGSVEPARLAELERHDRFVRTRARARRLLAVRPRTEEELRRALLRGDVEAPVVEDVLDELRHEGAVDDEAWARTFAEEKRRTRQYAPARIEAELLRRGIERELARTAAREPYEDALDAEGVLFDEACGLLQRRSSRYEGLESAVAGRRMAGLLNRAGYPASTAIDAVRVRLEEMEAAGLLARAAGDLDVDGEERAGGETMTGDGKGSGADHDG